MRHGMSLLLMLLLFPSCAREQIQLVRLDRTNPAHRMVSASLHQALQAAGKDPAVCQFVIYEHPAINAASAGQCRFMFSTGLANTGDWRLARAIVAHEVGHEVLGHADSRQAAVAAAQTAQTAASFVPGIGGLIASGAVLAVGMVALPAYSRSQETQADDKALEILRSQGDPDPAATMAYMFDYLLRRAGPTGGGLLDAHPDMRDRRDRMRSRTP